MAKKTVYRFKNIYDHIKAAAYTQTTAQVFYDFVEMFAMEIAIGVGIEAEKRIETFKRTASKYKEEELKYYQGFKTEIMNEFIKNNGEEIIFQDVLGVLFHELELQNHYKGQFFTPYALSLCMAKISLNKETFEEDIIEFGEPAAGAGGMAIAACQIASELNVNYSVKEVVFLIGDYQLNIARDYTYYYAYIQYKKSNTIKIAVKIEHYDLDVVLNEVKQFFKNKEV